MKIEEEFECYLLKKQSVTLIGRLSEGVGLKKLTLTKVEIKYPDDVHKYNTCLEISEEKPLKLYLTNHEDHGCQVKVKLQFEVPVLEWDIKVEKE